MDLSFSLLPCSIMMLRSVFSVVAVSLLLAACGQKGPLYMPAKPPPAPAVTNTPSATDTDTSKDKSSSRNAVPTPAQP